MFRSPCKCLSMDPFDLLDHTGKRRGSEAFAAFAQRMYCNSTVHDHGTSASGQGYASVEN
jgi:hypothetical protein